MGSARQRRASFENVPGQMSSTEQLLNEVVARFESNSIGEALSLLEKGLNQLRSEATSHQWAKICNQCVEHPLAKYVYEDPFTKWAYEKPRNYPGDAVLMDFIYGWPSIGAHVENASSIGKSIYEFSRTTQAVVA